MKIVVLSGKGGTGKTTVSNNLAAIAEYATLADCDVEEPNSFIFMEPSIHSVEDVLIGYPVINENKCVHCRRCAEFCRFNAIIAGSSLTLPLKEICHSCGGCAKVCREGAITYEDRSIGNVYSGYSSLGNKMVYGELYTGELSGVRIINRINEIVKNDSLVIVDSPPGTSCSTVTALSGCDLAVIVTEPTPFGLSDMKMVVDMLRSMSIPMAVVINKAGLGDDKVYDYCKYEQLEIVGEIPFEKSIALTYANGGLLVEISGKYGEIFEIIWNRILNQVVNYGCT